MCECEREKFSEGICHWISNIYVSRQRERERDRERETERERMLVIETERCHNQKKINK